MRAWEVDFACQRRRSRFGFLCDHSQILEAPSSQHLRHTVLDFARPEVCSRFKTYCFAIRASCVAQTSNVMSRRFAYICIGKSTLVQRADIRCCLLCPSVLCSPPLVFCKRCWQTSMNVWFVCLLNAADGHSMERGFVHLAFCFDANHASPRSGLRCCHRKRV